MITPVSTLDQLSSTSGGKTTNPTVKTLATVRSISQVDAKSPLMLQVDGGLSVALSDVKRIGI